MKYSHIIWDFNGTIIDDVDIGINALNTLLRKYGYKEINDKDHYRSIFGFPIKDYYARAGFDFNVIDYETLAPLFFFALTYAKRPSFSSCHLIR